jgi:diguanylate cyclase (GGDEF)-like protein/PAS domain S-box-containing protein
MRSASFIWKRFVTNGFRFKTRDVEYRRVYMINVTIFLISITLFSFSIYNSIVTSNHTLAAVEFSGFILLIGLLYYFQSTSNIRLTAYGILVLTFVILAALTSIVENREYAFYWLIVFPTMAIFLLGRKRGLLASGLFLGYFLVFMLQGYGRWEMAVFDSTSIINIVSASLFLLLIITYFDLTREEASNALELQTRRLEEEHAMLDRYVIVCTFDIAGNITYTSTAFNDISGYSKQELTGLINHFNMDKAGLEKMWAALSMKQAWSGELRNRNKQGEEYWMHAIVEPVFNKSNDNAIGYRLIGEDISNRKRVEELAISDYLTKLYNRAKLDEELSKEISRAIRYKSTFCLILVDIDHFKEINDSYGHQMGDTVLKQIANILQTNTREVDTTGRWGGEEFLIITPASSIDGGVQSAEKLRTQIESWAFESVTPLTASFGVVEYKEGDTIESIIKRVDKALYRAKNNGRNRVET